MWEKEFCAGLPRNEAWLFISREVTIDMGDYVDSMYNSLQKFGDQGKMATLKPVSD